MFSLGAKEPVIAKASVLVECSPCDIFKYLGDGFFENYPKWSPEVVELESLSAGPVKLGTLAKQVRIDQGRRTESKFKIDVVRARQAPELCRGVRSIPLRLRIT